MHTSRGRNDWEKTVHATERALSQVEPSGTSHGQVSCSVRTTERQSRTGLILSLFQSMWASCVDLTSWSEPSGASVLGVVQILSAPEWEKKRVFNVYICMC